MKTVLVVDDDGDSRLICSTILLHYGFRILQAEDGFEALRIAGVERPDLILMDVELPGLDGWSATRRLKADPATEFIPVVMLTAHASSADEARGRAAGAAGYLAKPCSPMRVLEEVRRLTSLPRDPEAPEPEVEST